MRVLTAAQMREADRRTIEEIGIPAAVLMENAGRAVVAAVEQRYADLAPGPVTILCGKGNNGGDGFVVARLLWERGWDVTTVVLAAADTLRGEARDNLVILGRLGAPVQHVATAAELTACLAPLSGTRLVIDALLGTGLATPVGGLYAQAIVWLNNLFVPVVAVDIPSGLDATSGRVLGTAVQAELTVSLAAAKLGQVLHPGVELCGELQVAEIGLPGQVFYNLCEHRLLDAGMVRRLLPLRPRTGHKGTFGHVLVVAGSTGFSGAAALTANGALRGGAGLVTLALPHSLQPLLAVKLTETMTAPLADQDGHLSLNGYEALAALWEGKSVLAIGPGLGRAEETALLVRRTVRTCPLPLVIDADGLNALVGHLELLNERPPATTILTPHPGEMARLLGADIPTVESDRVGTAREVARRCGAIVLLKGARTVIAAPDGAILINPTGTPGLASAGMGDVLTGLIAALLAQGAPALHAAAGGAWLHGRAAERLATTHGTAGLLAGDILAELPAARHELHDNGGFYA